MIYTKYRECIFLSTLMPLSIFLLLISFLNSLSLTNFLFYFLFQFLSQNGQYSKERIGQLMALVFIGVFNFG